MNSTLTDAIDYAKEMAEKHPFLKGFIMDSLDLCKSEIKSGESEPNEVEHFYDAVNEIIEVSQE